MLIVATLGRSALACESGALEAHLAGIARSLAPLARTHQLLIVHQMGAESVATPPGTAGADLQCAGSAGLVGHLLLRELRNAVDGVPFAAMLAQVVVAPAEPRPQRVLEMSLLRHLLELDGLGICLGCVPVQSDALARLGASAALPDPDEVAAEIAIELGADVLLLLTDVDAIRVPGRADGARIERLCATEPPPAGLDPQTMGRKLQAACRFAHTPGNFAVIGKATAAPALVAGAAGTCISSLPR